MDLSDPTRAITGALDGSVLAALAGAAGPLTVAEVAARSARGSEIGVRRTLARLTEQGVVRVTELGRTRAYELNRDHVAAEIADALADLRLTLWQRFRDTFDGWKTKPYFACVFGSAARGDGDAGSDIDVLLVHMPFPGEKHPSAKWLERFVDTTKVVLLTPREVSRWQQQIDGLRVAVPRWTGNRLQVLELSAYEWADHRRRATELVNDIDRDGIVLSGPRLFATQPVRQSR